MAGKSDPSIYDDRTAFGSSDELDEYGVWVKSEPQDLSASLPDIEELPDLDSSMDENFDLSETNDLSDGSLDLPDDFDLPDMDDSSGSGLEIPGFDDLIDDNLADVNLDLPEIVAPTGEDLIQQDGTAGFEDDSKEPETDSAYEDDSESSSDLEFEEIPEDSDLPEGISPVSIDREGFTEISMNDFMDSSGTNPPESIDFGNLDNKVSEMESFSQKISAPASSGSNTGTDLSTQLLQKIADELSSIKKEITSLKSELTVVRGEVKDAESADSKGFFDEEDDEKIALTGDELDNILNTADFTEETGSGEGIDGDLSAEESSDIVEINLEEEVSADTAGISLEDEMTVPDEAIKLDEELESTVSEDYDVDINIESENLPEFEVSSELNSLREAGAIHATQPPEDTSYLEEDPHVDTEDIIDDQIDFSDVVIDEPDLSSQISENPITEPEIENISIDLEMEDVVLEDDSGEESPLPDAVSEDFVFETEETLEIPSEEETEALEIPIIDILDNDLALDEIPDTVADENLDISKTGDAIPPDLKQELRTVLAYMDQLLESLPEDKIEEFAKSEYFDTYKKLFEELGLA
ncbi:MAG: hypothetical protein LBH07_04020 [Treponema sp.]|jgi:hypothetical protein|nr:hypothetical protein [Treponema sp.]